MPDMDFSEVLGAREFADTISVLSVTRNIGSNGVCTVSSSTTTLGSGVVIPGKGNLRRLDDGTRVTGYIDVYTKIPLTTGYRIDDANERIADVVTWHGSPYVVCATEDYSAFGAGFVKASCDLQVLNPSE